MLKELQKYFEILDIFLQLYKNAFLRQERRDLTIFEAASKIRKRNYAQTEKRAADNKRAACSRRGNMQPVLLSGIAP